MKIVLDSDDLPMATRLDTWRGMLCDTYMGLDSRLPKPFRSVIQGYALGEHTFTRIKSSRHRVERSPTLIKRDGLQLIFFGILLSGRAAIIQGGREAALERGSVVISDSSRPFQTHVDETADIIWLSLPKTPIAQRVRGIEDLVAISLRPTKPVEEMAIGLMASVDEALSDDLPAPEAETLTTGIIEMLAMTIASDGLAPTRSLHLVPRPPIQ